MRLVALIGERALLKSAHTHQYQQLLRLLVDARKAAGLTQVALAKRLSRPQSFVSKYERGERRLDVVEFAEVAQALDADPIALLRTLLASTGRRARK